MAFLEDQLFIGGLIIGFLVFGFIAIILFSQLNDAFSTADVDPLAKTVFSNTDAAFPGVVDWIFGLLFVGTPLIAFGLAFANFIPSFFFWVASLLAFVISILGFAIQTIYESVITGSLLVDTAARIPITNFFMENFGYYAVFVWLLLAIGTYVKSSALGSGGL